MLWLSLLGCIAGCAARQDQDDRMLTKAPQFFLLSFTTLCTKRPGELGHTQDSTPDTLYTAAAHLAKKPRPGLAAGVLVTRPLP